jgi:hypothetical protein
MEPTSDAEGVRFLIAFPKRNRLLMILEENFFCYTALASNNR